MDGVVFVNGDPKWFVVAFDEHGVAVVDLVDAGVGQRTSSLELNRQLDVVVLVGDAVVLPLVSIGQQRSSHERQDVVLGAPV